MVVCNAWKSSSMGLFSESMNSIMLQTQSTRIHSMAIFADQQYITVSFIFFTGPIVFTFSILNIPLDCICVYLIIEIKFE